MQNNKLKNQIILPNNVILKREVVEEVLGDDLVLFDVDLSFSHSPIKYSLKETPFSIHYLNQNDLMIMILKWSTKLGYIIFPAIMSEGRSYCEIRRCNIGGSRITEKTGNDILQVVFDACEYIIKEEENNENI
jgi:hypothetical protein